MKNRLPEIIALATIAACCIILLIGLSIIVNTERIQQKERLELLQEKADYVRKNEILEHREKELLAIVRHELDRAELAQWAARHNALEDASFAKALKEGRVHHP